MALNYITLNQLMASVESDLRNFADNGMIDRGDVIKIVRKVNADIGLKINRENAVILDVENYKAELPADFMYLQLAILCTQEYHHVGTPVLGTHTEEHNIPVTHYNNQMPCVNECGGCYWVTQQFKEKTIKYDRLTPLALTREAKNLSTENCLNLFWKSAYEIDIQNGEIITNFRTGKIYISYLSDMVDEDGNVIILDHPLTTEYYEYAVKKHLLENYMLNNDADVSQKLGYIKNELREARIRSLNFVTTPEYSEINKMHNISRITFYNKYEKIFN